MSELRVGTAVAAPGTRAFGAIEVTNHPGGGAVEIPVILVRGSEPGPVLWIDACIHGDEPIGALSVIRLTRKLDPEALRGAVVAVPAMNLPSLEAASRGNPLDPFAYDMNRIYPGKPDGRLTERLAWAHKDALEATADLEISIHSGGSHSYLSSTLFCGGDDASVELGKAMGRGWSLILLSPHVSGSPMAVMLEKGGAAISIELGGMCTTLPDEIWANTDKMVGAFENILRHYGMLDGEPHYEERWRKGHQEAVLANHGGLWMPARGVRFQEPVKEGEVVGRIMDVHGNVLEEVKTPSDGEIFGLRTLPTVRTGEWVLFFVHQDGMID